MKRLKYPLDVSWHSAISTHLDALKAEGKERAGFMYEAKTMADEVPRMVMLFRQERAGFPKTHRQCSHQAPEPLAENYLSCCLGVKTQECPHLAALQNLPKCTPDDIDTAKAWTCAVHISTSGGDVMREGFLLTCSDRKFWDRTYANMADEPGVHGS